MPEILTQLGGKFSREDDGIFVLKKKLTDSGAIVRFPEGDSIIGDHNGIPITFNSDEKDFYQVELEYLAAIKNCSCHIIYNHKPNIPGYIGESASVEILYAIAHNKPIVVIHKPIVISSTVWEKVSRILEKNTPTFTQIRLDLLPPAFIMEELERITTSAPNYNLTPQERNDVFTFVLRLIKSYKNR